MSLLGNIWVKLGLKSDDFNRGIDNAEKKTKSFGEMMKGVAAKVTAVVAAFKMLAGTVKIITNFEAAQSRLASILGTTVDNMGRLTESAIELGRKTQYTASQVTDLQTELAKLGFAEPQILAMQESVLKFAAAVGTDLASAAARAGATMRGFGLTAEETTDMLNVMAVSTSKSALSFNYLDSTLGKLVPVAKSFGLDTEGTIALLGTLANAGIDASSAGTALRAIFIKLADSSSKLNQAMGGQPKTMEDLIKGFQRLRDGGLELGDASDMVNDRFAAMLLTLANGADDVADLYGELQNANGALDEMYETMTHNVKGAVEQVKSAWEGFVLSLRGSSGILYTVLINVRDLIGELNYALFQSTKESTATSEAYDKLKRTIEQTADPLYALEQAYKKMLATANANVADLEGKSKLGRLLNHESLKEARAQVVGITAAYKQLHDELVNGEGAGAGGGLVPTDDDNDALAALLQTLGGVDKKHDGILGKMREELTAKKELLEDAKDETEIARLNMEIQLLDSKIKKLEQIGKLKKTDLDLFNLTDDQAAKLTGLDDETISREVDEALGIMEDGADKMKDIWTDAAETVQHAIQRSMIGAFEELAEVIGTGEWDTTAMVKALLNPLADAAISIGTIVMTSGQAMKALNEALESMGENPYAAIAIGAALVGVGIAAKAGIAALAKNSGGSGGQSSYSYTGGYGVTPAQLSQSGGAVEVVGTVTVKGQDLQIALDNYNRNKTR